MAPRLQSWQRNTSQHYCQVRNFTSVRCSTVVVRCTAPSSQPSYFEVLGVTEAASLKEIKGAFRAKSKLLHPDVNKSPTASRDFMLLRRAYTTLTSAELRAEYEAKLGMPSARARDPRFARFERWRREVIPDLRVQLDFWSRGLDGYLAAWRASVDRRERNLARLHDACVESLRQLQQLRSMMGSGYSQPFRPSPPLQPHPQQQLQQQQQLQPQQDSQLPYSEETFVSMGFATSVDFSVMGSGAASGSNSGGGTVGPSGGCSADELIRELEAALQNMAAEVAGISLDSGDGTARVDREVEKRYQQVSMRYPAYPDIVWLDVWEEIAEQWLANSASEAQRCSEATKRWSERLKALRDRVQDATQVDSHGQLAGAGTGRFNAG